MGYYTFLKHVSAHYPWDTNFLLQCEVIPFNNSQRSFTMKMLTKCQGGQKVTQHHFLKLYLLIRHLFTKTGPTNVMQTVMMYIYRHLLLVIECLKRDKKANGVHSRQQSYCRDTCSSGLWGDTLSCPLPSFCQVYKWPLMNMDIHNYKCFHNHHCRVPSLPLSRPFGITFTLIRRDARQSEQEAGPRSLAQGRQ